jgi:hypothetical protein
MQEVRSSNPRSSTFFRVDVREKVTNSSHLEPADLAPSEGCPHACQASGQGLPWLGFLAFLQLRKGARAVPRGRLRHLLAERDPAREHDVTPAAQITPRWSPGPSD